VQLLSDSVILERGREWATATVFDATTKKEIQQLLDNQAIAELRERFARDLEFGTGGLRGIVGAGTGRMNIYNIRKATQALANYMRNRLGDTTALKVAISYDSRTHSRTFAEAAAEVLAGNRIQVLFTADLRPVPMLSHLVRREKCQAGICVTASHNPPNYNGYKVYWSTGGQLVPPHDEGVIKEYLNIKDYGSIPAMPFREAVQAERVVLVGETFDEQYYSEVLKWRLNAKTYDDFKIVYSPLHGSGLTPVTKCLAQFGFKNVSVVPEQRDPNGAFPTVEFPNPEDPRALTMAKNLGLKQRADLIMATDPDCDRIGFAVLEGDDYFFPNGNQIGCLLTDYVLSSLKRIGKLPSDGLVVKTVVTTELQADISRAYGIHCDETLTGFKWICDRIQAYETGALQPRRQFICGGEESYGFLAGDHARDKDGVLACCLTADMVAWHKSQGKTISQVLLELYQKHGCYQETLFTLTLPGLDGAAKIRSIMQKLRQTPPATICNSSVAEMLDYENQLRLPVEQGKPVGKGQPLTLPRSDVLQFLMNDGSRISVRPSGTEPKIKFYISVRDGSAAGKPLAEVQKLSAQCLATAKSYEQAFVKFCDLAPGI
jgi:phosphoglucomutase